MMVSRFILILAVGLASLILCRSAQAQPVTEFLRVDGDAGSLPPPVETADGSTWAQEKAFRFLQDAIAKAQFLTQNPNVTVEIWIAATVSTNPYRPNKSVNAPGGVLDPSKTFSLHNRIQLYGGFLGLAYPGGGETQRSQRNPEDNITVLSGSLSFCEDEPAAGPCDQVHSTPGCSDAACCALVCSQVPVPCCNDMWTQTCVVVANAECGQTAGVDLRAHHVATADGVAETARLSGFTVTGGDAGIEGDGGGLLVTSATPVVTRCRFTENDAQRGGAVAVDASGVPTGHATVVDCALVDNQATVGGAVSQQSGSGQVIFVNCLFAENSAFEEGGAIVAFGDSQSLLELRNCTFTANSAGQGGAILSKFIGPVIVTNSILWDDIPDEIHVLPGGAMPVVTYSDVDVAGGFPGIGNINAPPMFVGTGDFHLSAISLCIDAGHNDPEVPPDSSDVDEDFNSTEYTPDLDLKPRVRKGTLGGCPLGLVDMGAYEFIPPGCPADCGGGSPDGVVDTVDFLLLLQQWGQQCTSCDIMSFPGVDTVDFLELLQHWGPCGAQQVSSPPKTVLDCYERYGFDAQLLAHCICAVAPCTEGCPPAGCH